MSDLNLSSILSKSVSSSGFAAGVTCLTGAGWNWISDLRTFFTTWTFGLSSFLDGTGNSISFFGWSTPVGKWTSIFSSGFSLRREISDLNSSSILSTWISSSGLAVTCSAGAGWNLISDLRTFLTIGTFAHSSFPGTVTSFFDTTCSSTDSIAFVFFFK